MFDKVHSTTSRGCQTVTMRTGYPRRPTSTPKLGCCKTRPDVFVGALRLVGPLPRPLLTCPPVYIGDASTLSILQLIRIVVENTAGSDMGSPFIDDPKRHRILESIIDFPDNVRLPSPLPDKETADVLIASYFTNVSLPTPIMVGQDVC